MHGRLKASEDELSYVSGWPITPIWFENLWESPCQCRLLCTVWARTSQMFGYAKVKPASTKAMRCHLPKCGRWKLNWEYVMMNISVPTSKLRHVDILTSIESFFLFIVQCIWFRPLKPTDISKRELSVLFYWNTHFNVSWLCSLMELCSFNSLIHNNGLRKFLQVRVLKTPNIKR